MNRYMIGDNIRKARKKAGISQLKLAQKMGIAQPRISRWEKGEVVPNVAYLVKLANILNITTDELINGGKPGD